MTLLTKREVEIARLCALGLTCKEIGQRLDLAPRTVEHHLERARMKCSARNCAHFVSILYEGGILLVSNKLEEVPVQEELTLEIG